MRRLASLVLLGLILVLPLPATAKPIATDVVTWTFDGGTVTLDTSTNTVTVAVDTNMTVECGGAGAFASIQLNGSGMVEVSIDRHGQLGSFTGSIEFTEALVTSGCGDYTGPVLTVSGVFETAKGKADRWHSNGDRFVARYGTGVFSIESLNIAVDVAVVRTISN